MNNLQWIFPAFLLTLCCLPVGLISAREIDQVTITILYDNTAARDEVQADWGFACLVEGLEQTILFDTGTKSEVLFHNAQALGKDLAQVDILVLSHDHRDHTGALDDVLSLNSGIEVYLPESFPAAYDSIIHDRGATPVRVNKAVEIFKGAALTGEMGDSIKEQSLILNTARGLVIITGCSHPGIINIIEQVLKQHERNIHLVLGGFHLGRHAENEVREIIDRFRELGVEKVGAAHCTGEQAIGLFRQAYGNNFVPTGAGQVIQLTP